MGSIAPYESHAQYVLRLYQRAVNWACFASLIEAVNVTGSTRKPISPTCSRNGWPVHNFNELLLWAWAEQPRGDKLAA